MQHLVTGEGTAGRVLEFQAGIEPMPSIMPVTCSDHWATRIPCILVTYHYIISYVDAFNITPQMLRERSFFRRGGGPEGFRGGSLTFCPPKREGQHKFDTKKRWVTLSFTASRGRITFFNKKR